MNGLLFGDVTKHASTVDLKQETLQNIQTNFTALKIAIEDLMEQNETLRKEIASVKEGAPGQRILSFGRGTSTASSVPSGSYFYFGDSGTDGSYRIYVSGSNLVTERRESGSWVEKSAILAS